jgi:hypothetical protein
LRGAAGDAAIQSRTVPLWIASSLSLLAMTTANGKGTNEKGGPLRDRPSRMDGRRPYALGAVVFLTIGFVLGRKILDLIRQAISSL